MSLARDFYAVYAPVIFGFIDVVLDHHSQVGGNWLRQGPGRWPKIVRAAQLQNLYRIFKYVKCRI